ncbi:(d)CMP kinase [Aestuariimicrobium ganziense]|uniref:(d)CMP kinase n=1 Tax=Aestuariimicrobium ganziense TaxID=2773677 RepID=UPI0019459591|nr:(d)CMP kinase [Aestuariimicrobium ganziense]
MGSQPLVVAIDGPSGSGKSSTARGLAQRLGLGYLDTGSMYRAVAVAYLESGLAADEVEAIGYLASQVRIEVGTDPARPTTAVDGVDVTATIREPRISQHVSVVATNLEVRRVLTDQMRRLISDHDEGIVVEGRDITTVVWPQAQVRVLLVADPAARIRRREAELAGAASTDEVTDQVVRRDHDDATVSQFETPADGVTLIDSTHLSLDEVIEAICALVPDPQE